MLKKKIINILLAVAVALLLLNVVTDKVNKPKKENISRELSLNKIETIFFTVMDDYGIEPDWIKKKKSRKGDKDSTATLYNIQIPSDTPIPLIIRDINKNIDKDVTVVVSEEKKSHGNTEIRIYSNETLKLHAFLQPDKNITRVRNLLSFIIEDANDLGKDEFKSVLSFPYPVALEIYPSEDIIPKLDSIAFNSKEYILVLNDEITDDKYKMKTGDQKELLKNAVNSILAVFPKSQVMLVDPSSKLYQSPIYNFVRDEFARRGTQLIPLNKLNVLKAETQDELISKFRFHCEEGEGNLKKVFLLSYDDFQTLKPDIERVKKKGNRILFPSKIKII